MRVPMCAGMPWDLTRVPNLLHHGTQGNAALAIEPFQALLDTNCSRDLRFFLCAMYAPVCAGALVADDPIRPCRAVCARARARCEPVVLRYGHRWPEALACDSLPVYEHAVCIQPEAIVLGLPHESDLPSLGRPFRPGLQSNECASGSCKCRRVRATRRTYLRNYFDFAVRVRSGGVRARGCRGARVSAHVERVLRGGGGPVRTGSAILHSDTPCVCPTLRPAQEYLLLCDTDSTHSRMMLRNGCVAVRWNETWTKKVKAWEKLRRLRKGASERHSWYKAKTVYIRRRRGDHLPS
uniref:secreted frizzled-related protein 3-like n=1 Tax=Myxine glutinosa TaxID=7769 RepID=UPI00358E43AA